LPEGEDLQTLVRLVNEHGEDRLLAAVGNCQECVEDASVILSTTHKAKGQQWKSVAVHNDFEILFKRSAKHEGDSRNLEAAARLLYVAMTRAQLALEPPPRVMAYFGLKKTRKDSVTWRPRRAGQSARFLSSIKAIFSGGLNTAMESLNSVTESKGDIS